ncbi:E3 ubiquitin-protein ligase SspH2 [Salmonella enterica subsp. arizonae]|uniref:E3 ubiquitin-protein ligase SspH2 n=1 Tax=Salmonella enterica subsp. arizonae TaxID=59203 RepID=A0A379SUL5_SALER|nr:E3 ubiquitin-protein ligase SspH2 [Salmonella enterica subsp. arizonae]
MKNVQLVHNAEKGVYDNNLPGLVSTGREMFRMEMLERIAREKARTLALVDEIEVYLAYQNKLKKPLGLSSVTAKMRFFGVSGVTASDLRSAERQVKAAEKREFSEWILQWARYTACWNAKSRNALTRFVKSKYRTMRTRTRCCLTQS